MTTEQSVRICMRKYATFRGRASKGEYWRFIIFLNVLDFVFTIIPGSTGLLLMLASFLITFLPSLAASTRRLQDVGKSGWTLLVPFYSFYLQLQPSQVGPNQWGEQPVTN